MIKKNILIRLINFWPPYLGAGIRVKEVNADFTSIIVELKLRWWNRNYVGTHFGGSLFAMSDPFFMLMLIENLGRDYIVWDKATNINFKKPGKGKVRVHFQLTQAQIADLKKQADENRKIEPVFPLNITDEEGEVVAELQKTLYIRRKDKTRGEQKSN